MEDNNLLFEANKNNECEKKCYYLGVVSSVIFFIGLLSYIVCGIAFLIGDYKLTSTDDNCFLWEYNLCYIILILVKLCLLKNNSKLLSINFCNCLIYLILEFLFFMIGAVTFIDNNDSCNSLINSNLWVIGICSLTIQILTIIFYTYFVLTFIIIELCKIKTPCCCTN